MNTLAQRVGSLGMIFLKYCITALPHNTFSLPSDPKKKAVLLYIIMCHVQTQGMQIHTVTLWVL